MKGASPIGNNPPLPSDPIEHTIKHSEAMAMSDMMRTFEEKKQQDHSKGDKALTELIKREIPAKDRFSSLITLGAISLLPDNQAMEQRLLQLGQKVVGSSNPNTSRIIDLKKVCKTFDKYFGPSHEMAEIDTKQQVYISWVKFDEQYYRIFTGTFAEGEVYLRDLVWKYEAVQKDLPESLGWAHDLLSWAFEKIDTFIETTGLVAHESSNGIDHPNTNIHLDDRIKDIAPQLSSSFTLPKDTLPENIAAALSIVSRKHGDYIDGGMTDFYISPVIEYDNHYVIPFPQLLINAIFKRVFDEIPKLENKADIRSKFAHSIKAKVANTLKLFFGEGSVLEDLKLKGVDWADFCVRYDGKLLFISTSASLAGESLSNAATQNIKRMFELREKYLKDTSLFVQSLKGSPESFAESVTELEPIVLTLIDNLDEDLMLGVGDIGQEALHDVIPISSFHYIVRHSSSPLDFIRYLRAVDDLRKRKIQMPGATPIDLFALYKEGSHQLREAEEDPNMLLIDLTSGARIITESTRKKRKGADLISLGGKKHYMRKHWDHFHGRTSNDHIFLYRTDVAPTIELRIPLSRQEASEELRHSIYIVFDSLCYFLDQKHSSVKDAISGTATSILITVEKAEKQKEAIEMEGKLDEVGHMKVTIRVSEKAHEVFLGEDNAGERKVIKLFADAIGISNSQAWLDKIMPPSSERNFQTNIFSLSHKSYENAPRPTRIEEGDRWWVDEVLSKAILADSIKPGSYNDAQQIGDLATRIAKIAKQKVAEKLAKYPRQQIIERSYTELEAVYAWDEHKDYESLAKIAIRGSDEVIEGHTQHNQDSTQLSFAYRYLIEASLQSNTEGDELLTDEAYLEILALAERYVDVEFWGDTTYLGLQPGRLYISKRGFPGIESTGNGRLLSQKRTLAALKSAKYRADYRRKIMAEGAPKPGTKEKTMYSTLNAPFKDEFDYTLEEFIDAGKAILDLFANFDSPIMMVSKKVLRDKISSETGIDKTATEKIIERLTLSSEVLQGIDINPSQRFWREEKLLNKPLVAMPLNENILLLTRAVVERTLLSFLDRLMAGKLEYLKNHQQSGLNKVIMNIVNQDAHQFEDSVCDTAQEQGLVVKRRSTSVGGTGIPKQGVGEIDGLAWSAKSKTVYVLEIKDNGPARSPIEIKTEIDNYYGRDKKKGYYKQLGDKYDWIKDHEDLLRKEFGINTSIKFKIKPVLVSNAIVASSVLKTPPYTTLTLDEFIESL